jgi:two-component system chemotaxis sensor kinase CheA
VGTFDAVREVAVAAELMSDDGYLSNLFAISGATILGNGEVALIIDSNQFIK